MQVQDLHTQNIQYQSSSPRYGKKGGRLKTKELLASGLQSTVA